MLLFLSDKILFKVIEKKMERYEVKLDQQKSIFLLHKGTVLRAPTLSTPVLLSH